MSNFPERLKQLRKDKGLTLKELAENLDDIKEASISRYENGKREPDIDRLLEIADFFNCSVDYLIGNASYKNAEDIINLMHKEGKDIEETIEALKNFKKSNISFQDVKMLYDLLDKIEHAEAEEKNK